MKRLSRLVRALRSPRWLAPIAVVAIILGGSAAAPALAGADRPVLADRTVQQVLSDVLSVRPTPLSGTLDERVSLGLPALPGAGSGDLSLTSLLTGSHEARIWYADPTHVRVAVQQQLRETDVLVSGRDVWTYDSQGQRVGHAQLPARTGDAAAAHSPGDAVTGMTPQQLARRLLTGADPTTEVRLGSPVTVAGRPAYQLLAVPRATDTLVGTVAVAVDARTGLPLRVTVTARGATKPAVFLGFTKIHYGSPAGSELRFAPPPGAVVHPISPGTPGLAAPDFGGSTGGIPDQPTRPVGRPDAPVVHGTGWSTVVELSGVTAAMSMTEGQPAHQLHRLLRSATAVTGSFGSGRVFQTALVSVLLTDDGRLFVGMVTPETLERAAGPAR